MSIEDGNLSTVPIEGTPHVEHDQLPAVEEAKLERRTNSSRSSGSGWKRWLLLGGAVVVIVLIIGLSVGLATRSGSTSHRSVDVGATRAPSGKLPPTSPPIAIPNTGNRERDVITLLAAEGLSDRNELITAGSPQRKAALFMANRDPLKLPLSAPNFLQRYAMVVFYYSLSGELWKDDFGFLSESSECSWHSLSDGVFCNDDDQVSEILLSDHTLNGTIPADIGLLSKLSRLELFSNGIYGPIPDTIFLLTELVSIQLDENSISGPLPQSGWDTLSNLQALYLGINKLTGQIPTEFSYLSNLTSLGLDQNTLLYGNIQLFSNLNALQLLYVDHNMLTGTLDDNFFDSLASLEELYLGHNQIHSTIPSGIFSHSSLRLVDLHLNKFEGPIPSEISHNTALEVLALYNNSLSGSVPPSLSNLVGLRYLDLSGNRFVGSIPTEIASLTDLTYLFLSNNNFDQGRIPSEFQNLAKLTDLSFQRTQRSGPIPDFLGTELSGLVLLDLSHNDLTGEIPTSLNTLRGLSYLLLNRNQLEGNVFNSIYQLSNLEVILLDHNKLTGHLGSFCAGLVTNNKFHIIGDCNHTEPQLDCPCCSLCCSADSDDCNNRDWLGNLEPIWETGIFPRKSYAFANESVNFE